MWVLPGPSPTRNCQATFSHVGPRAVSTAAIEPRQRSVLSTEAPANSETVFGSLPSSGSTYRPLTQIERKAVPILLKIDHLERDAAVTETETPRRGTGIFAKSFEHAHLWPDWMSPFVQVFGRRIVRDFETEIADEGGGVDLLPSRA
jgi:hypothetical protein